MADIADAELSLVLGILNGVQDEMSTAAVGERDSFAVVATAVAEDEQSSAGSDSATEEEWWKAEGMPWNHKPGRADYWCMGWIGFLGIFSLAMLPLRGWLLGLDPPILMGLTGSRTGAAATGALASVGQVPHWVWWLLLGSIMSIKLDWVSWWAGKLWGRGMIEVWAGRSERARRRYDQAEKWARKLGWLGVLVAYVPIPLPIMPVVFVLTGASGMKVRWFVALDFIAATVWNLGYLGLGWGVGDPIVGALKYYAKIANWVAIALVIVILAPIFVRKKQKA